MFIETEYTTEIDQKEISKFIFDKVNTIYNGKIPTLIGYTIIKTRSFGNSPIDLWAQAKEYYNVTYKNSVVANFNALIPVGLKAELTINSNLLLKDGIKPELAKIITDIFAGFKPTQGVDPNDYIQDQLSKQPDINSDMFAVMQSLVLDKKANSPKDQRQEIDRMLSLYNGTDTQSKIDVLGPDVSLSAYFQKKGYKAVKVKREELFEVQQPDVNPIPKVDNASKIEAVVIANAQGLDCGITVVEKVRISTVGHIPQFKADSGLRPIKIGCFRIWVPWVILYVRDNMQVLYACVGRNANLQEYLVQQLVNCIKKSALYAGVVGIILLNPIGALATFQSLLIVCVTSFGENEIMCLFPQLVIEEESSPWEVVYL